MTGWWPFPLRLPEGEVRRGAGPSRGPVLDEGADEGATPLHGLTLAGALEAFPGGAARAPGAGEGG